MIDNEPYDVDELSAKTDPDSYVAGEELYDWSSKFFGTQDYVYA